MSDESRALMIDPRQLVLPGSETAELVSPAAIALEQAVRQTCALNAWRPNTERTYGHAWKRYASWCGLTEQEPLPIDFTRVCGHLQFLARGGVHPAGVQLTLAALSALELGARGLGAGHLSSLRRDRFVALFMAKLMKEIKGSAGRGARAIALSELERMLAVLQDEPAPRGHVRARVPRWARDRAILLLGIAGALRRSEIAMLHAEDCEPHERGLILHVSRGVKTSPRTPHIERQREAKLCPVDAYEQWIKVRGDAPGRLFVAIDNVGAVHLDQPLRPEAIGRQIDRIAERAGLRDVTSHSLRKSFATWAAELEKSQHAAMRHGGWKRSQTFDRYVQLGTAWTANPTRDLFDPDKR